MSNQANQEAAERNCQVDIADVQYGTRLWHTPRNDYVTVIQIFPTQVRIRTEDGRENVHDITEFCWVRPADVLTITVSEGDTVITLTLHEAHVILLNIAQVEAFVNEYQ